MNHPTYRFEDDNGHAARDIYDDLARHQRSENWRGRELLARFQFWAERFNVHFKLDIPEIALCLDRLPVSVFGHFRVGHNGFGLKGEIAINDLYLNSRPAWQILGTICHECLHAWQHAHGHPSPHDHHNLEFRRKAAGFGLLIDRRGVTDYLLDSPFMTLLAEHGVEVPNDAEAQESSHLAQGRVVPRMASNNTRIQGKSTLIKWSCGCQNVRCGRAEFHALCMKCGNQFVRAS